MVVVVRTRCVALLRTFALGLTFDTVILHTIVGIIVRTIVSFVVRTIVTALLGTIVRAIGTLFVVFCLCIFRHGTICVLALQCHTRFADTRTLGSFFVVFHLFFGSKFFCSEACNRG